ncbi:hypothetical protein T265_01970 [Opisthorchis viverrini]|uniref:Uncharacterized protein n=1 Tax=Opisthorchis viverrini TaxID=6198 RepID=A0A074ZWP6_OPIVI|nr:hypothetical protein T265_01970 [Opisthorchis viverrini]KER31883.1 hypothetical protein T265_01970 [Opisthorchis viverrini]
MRTLALASILPRAENTKSSATPFFTCAFRSYSFASIFGASKSNLHHRMSGNETEECTPPDINLYNFDDTQFQTCRYVLTSPRSLEACAKLNIRPVELLFKSKEEFSATYKNFPDKKLEEMFVQHENTRKEKLMKARLERARLIKRYTNSSSRNSTDPDRKPSSVEQSQQTESSNKGAAIKADLVQNLPDRCYSAQQTLPEKYQNLLNKLPPQHAAQLPRTQSLDRVENRNSNMSTPREKSRRRSLVRWMPKGSTSPTDTRTSDGPTNDPSCRSSTTKDGEFWLRKCHEENEQSEERERRLRQAQERRRELDKMLETYRRELQEAREITHQRARERAYLRSSEEQLRKVHDRQQREQHIRENAKIIQQRQEEWRRAAEAMQKQKEEHVQKFLEEREAKIQESRNLAQAAEQLRAEMQRVYNLDSFDKKAQHVALLNELGLGGAST